MTDAPRFGPPAEDYEPPPAVPFTLYGRRLSDGTEWEETFSVLGQAPQGALTDLANGVDIKDGNIVYSASATVKFLRAIIVPLDEARFDALLADKDKPMPLEQLGEVMLWASRVVSHRPTGAPSGSSPGPSADADGSPAEQPGPDTPQAG
jgi:hypothetical protein